MLDVGDGGVVLAANDAFCDLVGHSRLQLLGDRPPYVWWPEEQHPWYAVQLGERFQHAVGRGEFAGAVRRGDGTTLSIAGHIAPDDGDPARLHLSVRPAHEWDRRVAAAGDADTTAHADDLEAYLHALFDANVIGMITGCDNHVLRTNDAFLAIVGYSRDEFEAHGIDWAAITPPEFFEADAAAGEEMMRTGASGPVDKQYFRRDGSRVSVRVAGAMLSRQPFRWASTVEDLTAEHAAPSYDGAVASDCEQRVQELTIRTEQLQTALDSRVVIEQAKGRLSGQLGISMNEAFSLLRERARENSLQLHELARSVAQGGAEELPPGRRSQGRNGRA